MSARAAILQPIYTGHVSTTKDALILFEACLNGHLKCVTRRPRGQERNSLIHSGCVFIYDKGSSGIQRWTDGVTWSPSRILGDFLVYRELDKPLPPRERKANKKISRQPARPGKPYPRPNSAGEFYSPTPTPSGTERQFIGSLTDSYGFKPNGLVKKTISVTVQGATYHLVSYYNLDDVKNGLLGQPSQAHTLSGIRPRPELTSKQSFRTPYMEETVDDAWNAYQGMCSGSLAEQNSNSYHPHSAYPQHDFQPGVSTGYSPGPTIGASSMSWHSHSTYTIEAGTHEHSLKWYTSRFS